MKTQASQKGDERWGMEEANRNISQGLLTLAHAQ